MRRIFVLLFALLLLPATAARADLIELKNGMIYDTLQDLTWLQDTRFARTSGFDADGLLPQFEAIAWAHSLEFGGLTDWRLPRSFLPGRTGLEHAEESSELAILFYQLGWRTDGSYTYAYPPSGALGPFLNFHSTNAYPVFWFENRSNEAWHPTFIWDVMDGGSESPQGAWAVREGQPNARVPEPSTLLVMGLGSLGLLRARRTVR